MELLRRLLAIDSPSGDEGLMADWLLKHLETHCPDARCERLGDSVLAVRGERPAVAVFAHTDTTGFTLGHDRELIPIGSPAPKRAESLRPVGRPDGGNRLKIRKNGAWTLKGPTDALPGSRWVYAAHPILNDGEITSPYLDNRAGVWAALQVLLRCPSVAIAFTVGEEHSGQGAYVSARRLFDQYGIRQALVADITWDTAHVHCGQGVAVSLRDRLVPRQRFLDWVLALADESGLPYQREIESSGGSDGASISRSGVSMNWVFVGAPEKKPHTSTERLNITDLQGMADLLTFLVDKLQILPMNDYA